MNEKQAEELRRRLYRSERNAEGNYTADELYTRLKFRNPWVEDPECSSQITGIDEVLEFLEQFPVGDVEIIGPNTCRLDFDRPLSGQEIKDLEMELNASFIPDEKDDRLVVAVFDPRSYDGDGVLYESLPALSSKGSNEERAKKLRAKEKDEIVSHAENERLHLQRLKEIEAKTTSKLNPRETIARIADEHGLDETNYDTARILFYYVVKELVAPDLPHPETPISDAIINRLEDLSKIRFNQFLDLSGAG